MKCPVCRSRCEANSHSCAICGFDQINFDFLNVSDAEAWSKKVKLAKMIWFMNENYEDFDHFNSGCNTVERTLSQLNVYFDYSEQLNYIIQNPQDFVARSWFIDCLREVYVLHGTFPTTSRKYVKGIIEEHMSFFERTDVGLGKKREYIICEHLVHRAEMALSDCDFTSAFRFYQQYLFKIKRMKDIDYLAQIEEAARHVLHNCHVICKVLCVHPGVCETLESLANQYYENEYYNSVEGQELLNRTKEREHNALFIHTLGCGLLGAYYTDKDDTWQLKTHQATFDSCCFDFNGSKHFSACDFSIDCQPLSVMQVNGLMYRVEYLTDAFSISDAIYMHKDAVEQLAIKLTTIQGLFD